MGSTLVVLSIMIIIDWLVHHLIFLFAKCWPFLRLSDHKWWFLGTTWCLNALSGPCYQFNRFFHRIRIVVVSTNLDIATTYGAILLQGSISLNILILVLLYYHELTYRHQRLLNRDCIRLLTLLEPFFIFARSLRSSQTIKAFHSINLRASLVLKLNGFRYSLRDILVIVRVRVNVWSRLWFRLTYYSIQTWHLLTACSRLLVRSTETLSSRRCWVEIN